MNTRLMILLASLFFASLAEAQTTFYVRDDGGGSACTQNAPCAYSRLSLTSGSPRPAAGQTWIVMNNTKGFTSPYPPLNYNCSAGSNSGTSDTNRVVIKAQNERAVLIKPASTLSGYVAALQVTSC